MRKRLIFICIALCIFMNVKAFGEIQKEDISAIVGESVDVSRIDRYMEDVSKDIDGIDKMSFGTFVDSILKGDFYISPSYIFSIILRNLFKEILKSTATFGGIMCVMVLSSILKSVTSSFCGKSVGEMGFYVCYMIMVLSICDIFRIGAELTIDAVKTMGEFLNITIPVFISIAISTGSVGEGVFIAPFISGMSTFIIGFISKVIVPSTVTISVFELITYISERNFLKSITEFMKKCISMILKGVAILFTVVLSLQKIAIPTVTGIFGKTLMSVTGSIPIVGDAIEGAVKTTLSLFTATKGCITVFVIIFMIIVCFLPFVKLFAIYVMYRLASAFSEPFCDKRLTGCIDCASEFTSILIGIILTSGVIFTFSIIIMVSSGII